MNVPPKKPKCQEGVVITQQSYTEHIFKIHPGDHDNQAIRLTIEAKDTDQLCNLHLKHSFKQIAGNEGNKRVIEQHSELILQNTAESIKKDEQQLQRSNQ